jgi:hypothetical protein
MPKPETAAIAPASTTAIPIGQSVSSIGIPSGIIPSPRDRPVRHRVSFP